MPIRLPRIEGTAHDAALNEFINAVNREFSSDQPKLAAHAVVAIGRFLIENHEVEAGALWTGKAMPLVEHITIIAPMADKLHKSLVDRTKQRRAGCSTVVTITLFGALAAAGLAWWWLIPLQ